MTDPTFEVTFFLTVNTHNKDAQVLSTAHLVEMIEMQTAADKELLPLLKLAHFGNLPSPKKGSLRWDGNVEWVTGCEGDYDQEKVPLEAAKEKLEKAGVYAILYTTPSWREDAPRWRVLCPFSKALAKEQRGHMVARLNGLLGGILADESFVLSQSYFYGSANGKSPHVEVVDGHCIDECDELDKSAIWQSAKKKSGNGEDAQHSSADIEELTRRILSGEALHTSVRSIAGAYAARGESKRACLDYIGLAFTAAHQPRYGGRWDECVKVVDWCYDQEAKKNQPPPASPQRGYVDSAAELKGMTFMPLQWIVPRYFPEGVTLLAGKPKLGKSWLMLATALASTMEREVLNELAVKHNVLYCALEDTRRRMKSRIEQIIGLSDIWPDNLHFIYELPNLDQGCIARLQDLVNTYHPSVIIIDTLIRIRGAARKNEDPVQRDYHTMNALADFGKQNALAVIVVHHVRKQTAEDVFDTISGTLGLSAAADTLAILTRASNELRLVIRGRDVEPEDKIVDFDLDTGAWTVTGDYESEDKADTSSAAHSILTALTAAKYSMKPADIATQTGLPKATVRQTLRRMDKAGKVKRTQYGTYEPAR